MDTANKNITHLPDEIIIIIIHKLDSQSQECFYNTCQWIRDIFFLSRVTKACLSMNTMATANTFKRSFFRDFIATHLRELNLCAVNDLDLESLLPALRQLPRLDTLDISYTNLTLMDIADIRGACPTLKNICINFAFSLSSYESLATFSRCQFVFAHFRNVHFICTMNCTWNRIFAIGFFILQNAKLQSLKFTLARVPSVNFSYHGILQCNNFSQFNELTVYILNWQVHSNYSWVGDVPITGHEIIIIVFVNEYSYKVFASTLFHEFFRKNFNVEAEPIAGKTPMGNMAIMVWKNEATEYNEHFYVKLKKQLRQYLPYICVAPIETPAPKPYNWYCIVPKVHEVMTDDNHKKKNEVVATDHILNFDTTFKDKTIVQLKLFFNDSIPGAVTLTPGCEFLRKLTFLSLSGNVVYTPEFFSVLFGCCDRLVTLNVHAPVKAVGMYICTSISVTRSLKNFRLEQPRVISRDDLISAFCYCPTLEIFHLSEEMKCGSVIDYITPVVFSMLLEKSNNLKSLYINSWLTEANHAELLEISKDVTSRINKRHLSVVIKPRTKNIESHYDYSPYMEVFNLTGIKPL